ncbi:MAG: hypothetical protein ACRBI6_21585 [Acidimicrobiales bacterium]
MSGNRCTSPNRSRRSAALAAGLIAWALVVAGCTVSYGDVPDDVRAGMLQERAADRQQTDIDHVAAAQGDRSADEVDADLLYRSLNAQRYEAYATGDLDLLASVSQVHASRALLEELVAGDAVLSAEQGGGRIDEVRTIFALSDDALVVLVSSTRTEPAAIVTTRGADTPLPVPAEPEERRLARITRTDGVWRIVEESVVDIQEVWLRIAPKIVETVEAGGYAVARFEVGTGDVCVVVAEPFVVGCTGELGAVHAGQTITLIDLPVSYDAADGDPATVRPLSVFVADDGYGATVDGEPLDIVRFRDGVGVAIVPEYVGDDADVSVYVE